MIAYWMLSIFVGMLAVLLVIQVAILRVCLVLVKAPVRSWRRVVLAMGILVAYQIAAWGVALFVSPSTQAGAVGWLLVQLAAAVGGSTLIIAWVFRTAYWRAFVAWITSTMLSAAVGVFLAVMFNLSIGETFEMASGAMAPTLLGEHIRGRCEKCGEPAYCSPPRIYSDIDRPWMICEQFHVTQPSDFAVDILPPDRFCAAKFIAPRRWDMGVFYPPQDPSTLYVMRLVGMPGERITIKDGKVWANGVALQPPADLDLIKYLPHQPPLSSALSESPLTLAQGEYYVLGDFRGAANDSRLWGPLPESNVYGVVAFRYWPWSRWRVFR